MISGEGAHLAERLRFRELDAVVTEVAMGDPELTNLERAEVPVALTCAMDWRKGIRIDGNLPSHAITDLTGANDVQWVMPSSRFKLRAEIDQFFENHNIKGRIVFESDVVASLVRSVIDEIGLAFLPLLYVAREVRAKSIRVLGPLEGYWKYRVWLVCHKQNRGDALVQSLARSFNEVCEKAIS